MHRIKLADPLIQLLTRRTRFFSATQRVIEHGQNARHKLRVFPLVEASFAYLRRQLSQDWQGYQLLPRREAHLGELRATDELSATAGFLRGLAP